jgi:hypothetical protein
MGSFIPTYRELTEDQPFTPEIYNQLVADLQAYLTTFQGSDLAVPLTLDQSGQDLDMSGNNVGGFRGFFGTTGGDGHVLDVAGGFGADPTGASDSTSAFQEAIDSLPATGGCILVVPGTYIIDGLKLNGTEGDKNNVMLWGWGPASILKTKASATNDYMVRVSGDKCVAKNVMFDGNVANQSSNKYILDLRGSSFMKVRACEVRAFYGTAIRGGGASNLSVLDTDFVGTTGDSDYGIDFTDEDVLAKNVLISRCVFDNIDEHAIEILAVRNCAIANCIFANGGTSAYYVNIRSSENVSPSGVSVRKCTMEDAAVGVGVVADFSRSIKGVMIDGNTMKSQSSFGIYLLAGGSSAIYGGVISNNQVREASVAGIGVGRNIYGYSIIGNQCSENQTYGIWAGGYGGVHDCVFLGNICSDYQSSPTQDYGIYLSADAYDNVVVGNNVKWNATTNLVDLGEDNVVSHNKGDDS